MAISTFKRYELKFQVPLEKKILLEKIIREHMSEDTYCVNGKKYLIRNIYFDTEDNALIHFSTTKPIKHKEKIRARKYGEYGDGKDKIYLEIKKKTEGIVSKRRVSMTSKELKNFIENGIAPAKGKYIDNQVLKELKYFLSIYKIKPAVFISYERLAFFDNEDSSFRVTFDNNIITRRDNLDFDAGPIGEKLLPEDMYLMEVKITNGIPLWFARALSDLEIYSSSYSKYGNEYRKMITGGKKECLLVS